MFNLLVYYKGYGAWKVKDYHQETNETLPYQFYQAEVNGLFKLHPDDERTLKYKNEVTVKTLLPATTHVDAVRCIPTSCKECLLFKYRKGCSNYSYYSKPLDFETCIPYMDILSKPYYFEIFGTGKCYDDFLKTYRPCANYKGETYTLKDIIPDAIPTRQDLPSKIETEEEPEIKRLTINDRRIAKIYEHLELLEKTAVKNGIPFDRQNLMCSKKLLLNWLKRKPGNLFNKLSEESFKKVWQQQKKYKLCPPTVADEDFFKKIQG